MGGVILYIPMMKTRQEELKVTKNLNYCYSDEIIPLFEVLNEIYEIKYQFDNDGNYIMELKPGKKKKNRVEKPKTTDDIITLDKISDITNKSKVFIDYFRFDVKKYGTNLKVSNLELAYRLNNNNDEYVKKLKAVSDHVNMIPVLSLKKPFLFTTSEIREITKGLQGINSSIAIRIEDELFDSYNNIIEELLRSTDYLLYDISEQNFNSKVMEFEELKESGIKAKKVILNSPRSTKLENKQFENASKTDLIDNSAAGEYREYGFEGFGDYGGLKDQLPSNDIPDGKGAALALLYNYEDNYFYSFCNSDTRLGLKGYHLVIEEILEYKSILDIDSNCEAYLKIQSLVDDDSTGGWGTWNNITLTRYLHQMHLGNKKRIE